MGDQSFNLTPEEGSDEFEVETKVVVTKKVLSDWRPIVAEKVLPKTMGQEDDLADSRPEAGPSRIITMATLIITAMIYLEHSLVNAIEGEISQLSALSVEVGLRAS